MKILVVGGTGTIGQAVVKELSARHSIIVAGHQSGDVRVDITDAKSIEQMFQKTGKVDAVISTTGTAHFAPLADMTADHFYVGLRSKLMGQVNLVLIGRQYLNASGSFTLTSGILSQDPIRGGVSLSMVNGALDAFVRAAAIELTNSMRINVISPTVLMESMEKYGGYFRGFNPVSAQRVALAFSKSVEGGQTGRVYQVG